MIGHGTPTSYARYLAGYINDPSTIRVRVKEEFGRSPSVDIIKAIIETRQAKDKVANQECDARFRSRFTCGHPETADNILLGENGRDYCRTCEEAKINVKRQRELDKHMRERAAIALKEAERDARLVKIEKSIKTILTTEPKRPRLGGETIKAVANYFKLEASDIVGRKGSRIFVDARIAVTLIMRDRDLSYPQIGRFLNRDHTTIIHLARMAPERILKNPKIIAAVEALR